VAGSVESLEPAQDRLRALLRSSAMATELEGSVPGSPSPQLVVQVHEPDAFQCSDEALKIAA